MPPESCPHKLDVEIAVVTQRQNDMDRRHDDFMNRVTTTMSQINTGMVDTRKQIESIHGHLTRCRDELRDEIDRDFLSKTEAERIRGSIGKINTRLTMTGLGIVLALSLVQVAIAVYA